jgi:hypothetical protein
VLADCDEIEWQVLTQGDSYLDAICHQIGDHLPESEIERLLSPDEPPPSDEPLESFARAKRLPDRASCQSGRRPIVLTKSLKRLVWGLRINETSAVAEDAVLGRVPVHDSVALLRDDWQNGSPDLADKSNTQAGAAFLALIGLAAMMAAKAWMDAVVRARGQLSCPSCNKPVRATVLHCAHCGAPQRTTPEMLRTLAGASNEVRQRVPRVGLGCGSQSASDTGFCRSCGRSLSPTNELAAA